MGFFKDLWDANPHKSVARGRELASKKIIKVGPDPNIGEQCQVCKKFFKHGLKTADYPFCVTVAPGTKLSFHTGSDLAVCGGCVEVFQIG